MLFGYKKGGYKKFNHLSKTSSYNLTYSNNISLVILLSSIVSFLIKFSSLNIKNFKVKTLKNEPKYYLVVEKKITKTYP